MKTPQEQVLVKELGKSGVVVLRLLSDLYRYSDHQYVDNWYSSESLFNHLSENGTVVCGTAKANRAKAPQFLKAELLQKGPYAF